MARQYLSPSLDRLFNELNARWPNRDRRTDGWYTNSRESYGHNRNERGLVHAIDVDDDGIDEGYVLRNIYKGGNVLWYVIWNRKIYSRKRNFEAANYTGPNPHTDHMHIEIMHTVSAEQYKGHWGIAPGSSGFGSNPENQNNNDTGGESGGIYQPAMNEGGRDFRGFADQVGKHFDAVARQAIGGARVTRDLRR